MATEGQTAPQDLGRPLPEFRLSTVDGQQIVDTHSLAQAVAVVMFICNHCPYVKAIEDRMIALYRQYQGRGVAFVGICSNDEQSYPDDAPAALAARARDKGYGFPYLHDPTQQVARDFGAVCTPEFFVYDQQSRLCYRGRMDDSWKDPTRVRSRELAAAIEAACNGQPPLPVQRPALGCSIKWRDA